MICRDLVKEAMLILKLRSRDHRNYLCYMARLKEEYGSVMEYVRDRRLGWRNLEAKGEAFEDAGMFYFCFCSCVVLFYMYERDYEVCYCCFFLGGFFCLLSDLKICGDGW